MKETFIIIPGEAKWQRRLALVRRGIKDIPEGSQIINLASVGFRCFGNGREQGKDGGSQGPIGCPDKLEPHSIVELTVFRQN